MQPHERHDGIQRERPPSVPTDQPTPAPARSLHTWLCLAGFYLLAVVWGVRSYYHNQRSELDLIVPLALAICLGAWALVDARRQRRPIPLLTRLWFFVLAPLVVPGYLILTRGWRGVGWVILHAVLWYGLATISLYAVWAVLYVAWLYHL